MKTELRKFEELATTLSRQRDDAIRERDSARIVANRALAQRDEARGEIKRLLEDLLRSLNGALLPQQPGLVEGPAEELLLIRRCLMRAGIGELGEVPQKTLAQVEVLVTEFGNLQLRRSVYAGLLKRIPKALAPVPRSLIKEIAAALAREKK